MEEKWQFGEFYLHPGSEHLDGDSAGWLLVCPLRFLDGDESGTEVVIVQSELDDERTMIAGHSYAIGETFVYQGHDPGNYELVEIVDAICPKCERLGYMVDYLCEECRFG